MTKSAHAAWLAALDQQLLALGAQKTERDLGFTVETKYTIQTQFGPLTIHPYKPFGGLSYDCTIFGRFEGSGPYPAAANPHSGKWNHHYGARRETELTDVLAEFRHRLEAILPASTPAPALNPSELSWSAWTNQMWENVTANLGAKGAGMVVLEQQTIRSAREKLCCSCGDPGTKPQTSHLIKSVKTYFLCDGCDEYYNSPVKSCDCDKQTIEQPLAA